jgi:hypothetical protein
LLLLLLLPPPLLLLLLLLFLLCAPAPTQSRRTCRSLHRAALYEQDKTHTVSLFAAQIENR